MEGIILNNSAKNQLTFFLFICSQKKYYEEYWGQRDKEKSLEEKRKDEEKCTFSFAELEKQKMKENSVEIEESNELQNDNKESEESNMKPSKRKSDSLSNDSSSKSRSSNKRKRSNETEESNLTFSPKPVSQRRKKKTSVDSVTVSPQPLEESTKPEQPKKDETKFLHLENTDDNSQPLNKEEIWKSISEQIIRKKGVALEVSEIVHEARLEGNFFSCFSQNI